MSGPVPPRKTSVTFTPPPETTETKTAAKSATDNPFAASTSRTPTPPTENNASRHGSSFHHGRNSRVSDASSPAELQFLPPRSASNASFRDDSISDTASPGYSSFASPQTSRPGSTDTSKNNSFASNIGSDTTITTPTPTSFDHTMLGLTGRESYSKFETDCVNAANFLLTNATNSKSKSDCWARSTNIDNSPSITFFYSKAKHVFKIPTGYPCEIILTMIKNIERIVKQKNGRWTDDTRKSTALTNPDRTRTSMLPSQPQHGRRATGPTNLIATPTKPYGQPGKTQGRRRDTVPTNTASIN